MIKPNPTVIGIREKYCQQFATDNASHYRHMDWALDIREAEFVEADIRGIPARLIRRDRPSQVIVTRGKALEGMWQQLDLKDTYWPIALKLFLEREDDDVVLVAPKAHNNYEAYLGGLERLRKAGVAEPD
jgi:hypothetical protein